MNLPQLVEEFGSEAKCRAYLEALRWKDGVVCPRCASRKISRVLARGQFDCDSCRYQFSVTAGTIFHDSHLPLWKWLLAAYMMAEAKKSVSANQLKRTLAVSYKTAWYLCHRIRAAMQDANPVPLTGVVEVDETYVGGKARNVHGGRLAGGARHIPDKAVVIGAVQRGGNIRLKVIPHARQRWMTEFVKDVTDPSAEVYTDDHRAYKDLPLRGRAHKSVNHSAGEYVRADVHTNTIESAWSLFKRSIVGSYHQISVKHMPAYLDEQAFRFNNRKNPFLFRDTVLRLLGTKVMSYRSLVTGA
jgi:transposase-like protein